MLPFLFTAKKINYSRKLPSTINGVPGTQITWVSDKPQSVSIEEVFGEIRGER
ncbi:hypothetical protein TREVI0001_0618 [Treponema vincentii ATCC 35580]|uniref:Uncharacterized protein n=1 Tax=Treponema vincentii ATCC 35580 TaxID=596324 RepID=C8PMK3_9SPIR|nr:hypothetical protein TREVI0001_0618 [Treponema vincentii ATCC 35580]